MAAPALQAKACWNSGAFDSDPNTRYLAVGCGSAVLAPGAQRSPVVDDLIDALRGSPQRGLLLTAAAEAGGDPPRGRRRSR